MQAGLYKAVTDSTTHLMDVTSLVEKFPSVNFKRKEFVYQIDSTTQKVYFLVKGRVKLGREGETAKGIITDYLSPGTFFGEQGLNGMRERIEFAQAVDDVEVKVIKLNTLREMMLENGAFALHFTQMMSQKLGRARERWHSQVHDYARTRIINFIVSEAKENGRQVGMERLIMNFLAHHEIASLTGSSRQTVTIVLNELRSKNLIYFDRKRLLVRDIDNLVQARDESAN